jgi:hypothetical protein
VTKNSTKRKPFNNITQAQVKLTYIPHNQSNQHSSGEKTKYTTTKLQTKTNLNPKANDFQSQKDVA